MMSHALARGVVAWDQVARLEPGLPQVVVYITNHPHSVKPLCAHHFSLPMHWRSPEFLLKVVFLALVSQTFPTLLFRWSNRHVYPRPVSMCLSRTETLKI